MAQDDQPRRPPGASRARTGGSARPLNDGAAASGAPSRAPAATPGVPPSISPASGSRRPISSDGAIPVGRPTRPSSPARPATARLDAQGPAVTRPPARPGQVRPGQVRADGTRAPLGATRPSVGPSRPPVAPPRAPGRPGSRRKRLALVAAGVAVLLLAWPIGLLVWANGKINHVEALSGAENTPGTTYLIAGSDSRSDGAIEDPNTPGARTDTIMLLQVPASGPAALVSLPRDTYTPIPGHDPNKLNAAYSKGGAPLLVQTVEGLTGMHVDHYVEIGLGGVGEVVDAVGGVELCLDPAVNKITFPLDDVDSGLVWDAPGCKLADGGTALAFTRMRKSDNEGDIGRAKRQQQLISAVTSTVARPSLLLNPGRQVSVISAGLGALRVSESSDILDLGRMALAFRSATGPDGIRGTPPILDADYRPGGVGSTVELDPETAPAFFAGIMAGTLPPGPVGGMPSA